MEYTKRSALIDASVVVAVMVVFAIHFLIEKTTFGSRLSLALGAYLLAALFICSDLFPSRSVVLKLIHAVTTKGMKTRSEANGIVCGILFVIAATAILIHAFIFHPR
jgi:ABC-type uncharacterized transport system permease subunit